MVSPTPPETPPVSLSPDRKPRCPSSPYWLLLSFCGGTDAGITEAHQQTVNSGREDSISLFESHRAGGQISVFVLQLAIQGQASLFPVVAQQGGESVDVAAGGARTHLVTEMAENRI